MGIAEILESITGSAEILRDIASDGSDARLYTVIAALDRCAEALDAISESGAYDEKPGLE